MKKTAALALILILGLISAPIIIERVSLTEANFHPFKHPYCDISIHSPEHMMTYDTGNIVLNFTAKTKDNIPPSYYYFYSLDGQDIQSSVKINRVQIINEEYITGDTLESYTETTLLGQVHLSSLSNRPHSIRVFTGGFLRDGTIYPAQMNIDSFSATAWFFVGNADASAESSSISEPIITSPKNKTYNSRVPTLKATACWFFASIKSMSYTVDGKSNILLSFARPESESFNHMNGTVIGKVVMPEFAEGPHSITVQVKGTGYFPEKIDIIKQATVYFTVDVTPPVISGLSVENKTYNQLDLPLVFTVNEATSWMGYSLDNEAIVTLFGNTTLTLKEGLHRIVVYANDIAGNMVASEEICFAVEQVFPTIPVAVGIVTTAFVGLGFVLYFIKRK